jgi:hypothetical protein
MEPARSQRDRVCVNDELDVARAAKPEPDAGQNDAPRTTTCPDHEEEAEDDETGLTCAKAVAAAILLGIPRESLDVPVSENVTLRHCNLSVDTVSGYAPSLDENGGGLSALEARVVGTLVGRRQSARGARVVARLFAATLLSVAAALVGQSLGARTDHGGATIVVGHAGIGSTFTPSGVTLRAGASTLRLSLAGITFGRVEVRMATVAPVLRRGAVVYDHGTVGEWYRERAFGLEQGFIVRRAPAGVRGAAQMSLVIATAGARPGPARLGTVVFGRRAFFYTGLVVRDARGRRLPATLAVRGRSVLVRVTTRGGRFPIAIDPFVQQGATLMPGDEIGGARFGVDVAVSADGDTLIAGGLGDNSPSTAGDTHQGAAWVFVRSGSTWSEQAKLTVPGTAIFGVAVALSDTGNEAVIADRYNNNAEGAIWAASRSGTTWTLGPKVPAPDGSSDTYQFGWGLGISGDGKTVVAGTHGVGGGFGGTWAFSLSGTTLTLEQELNNTGVNVDSSFGGSVTVSGDGTTAVVGDFAGQSLVFVRSGTTWSKFGGALPTGTAVSISQDGSILMVGQPQGSGSTNSQVLVYTRTSTGYVSQGQPLDPSDPATSLTRDNFGGSIALTTDGDEALIAAPTDGANGAAWIFTRSGATWSQLGARMAPSDAVPDFASAVALAPDGALAVVGDGGTYSLIGAKGQLYVFADPSTCSSPSATGPAGQSETVSLSCTGAGLTYAASTLPSHGTLGAIDQATGQISYTPNPGFSGIDGFTYTATNSAGVSNVGTVTIVVSGGSPPPPTTTATAPPSVVIGSPVTGGSPPPPTTTATAPPSVVIGSPVTNGASLTVKISCTGRAGQRCLGTVRVTAKTTAHRKGKHPSASAVVVGSAPYAVAAGSGTNLTIVLNATGRKLLEATYRLPAVLSLDGGAQPMSVSFAYGRISSFIGYTATFDPSGAVIAPLYVIGLPAGGSIVIRCYGHGCPFALHVTKSKRSDVTLTPLLAEHRLSPGAELLVEVVAPNRVGKVLEVTIHAAGNPGQAVLCLPPGMRTPERCA